MILFISNAPTEILAMRSIAEGLPEGFPEVRAGDPSRFEVPSSLEGVDAVLVRLLGGRRAWEPRFSELRARCLAEGVPLLAFGGEAAPDAELAAASTVPSATLAQAFEYLVHGGLANLEHLVRFVSDTLCMTGFGFEPPVPVPATGVYRRTPGRRPPGSVAVEGPHAQPTPPDAPQGLGTQGSGRQPTPPDAPAPHVAVVFYRAHLLAGNTGFVDDLCEALEQKGARVTALWCYSLRPDAEGRVEALELLGAEAPDAVVTTVLVSGSAAADGLAWDASALGALGVPVVQAITATCPRADWEAAAGGLLPMDVAMRVAIPEFDGRIISVPFSFQEEVDDWEGHTPVTAYRTVADRTERVAGLAVRLAALSRKPPADRRVAVVLSAYPTRRSRIGNAVALDTPASLIRLLEALRAAGYRVERVPESGDALMAELADGLSYDTESLGPRELARAMGRMPASRYSRWWAGVPEAARQAVEAEWGPPPGQVHVDEATGELVFAGLDLGGVLVAVQPPRGFGGRPAAVYHSPDLPPTHHYLAFYRFLDEVWGADAVIHLGKHGTLEWLPGKGVGLSGGCYPDLALGDLPLVYPFVVNDPGEGTQAKRRAHATIVDHLLPPMTRADSYDEIAKLEQLLDEHAQVASLDPSKLPAIREKVWELMVEAQLHRDLGLAAAPGAEEWDALVNHIDGYLCELKDAQIRGGLHVLGQPPQGEALLDLLLALTRLPQAGAPSLRQAVAARLGVELEPAAGDEAAQAGRSRRAALDVVEEECRRLLAPLVLGEAAPAEAPGPWRPGRGEAPPARVPAVAEGSGEELGRDELAALEWVAGTLLPALARTSEEIGAILAALDGRYVPPGPSGAPTRGMAHVLPTGRNFYSVDPKALPTRLAWEVGERLAAGLLERHLAEEGSYPSTVGLVVWGTAAMRTGGDDVAMALALLGVRPVWQAESGRVLGVERIPDAELMRPRVDVVLRVSGFFRDAFPHLISLLDEAVSLAGFDTDGDPRIFGAKPGAYGSGILPLIESRDWRSDEDLAQVYLAWGGYSYGRRGMGVPAGEAMRRRFAAIEVAVKNQDNREHDIFDSDDYLQDHGGMVATIRALRGTGPKAWFGDSSNPAAPRVRSLAEEAARVVRSRVVNPKWIAAMARHGYKGAFELAATVDYLFGYDATARVVEDWMYERVTAAYLGDPEVRKFLEESNPWALCSMAERLLEAVERGLWDASERSLEILRSAVLEGEGWEESR